MALVEVYGGINDAKRSLDQQRRFSIRFRVTVIVRQASPYKSIFVCPIDGSNGQRKIVVPATIRRERHASLFRSPFRLKRVAEDRRS